MQPEIDLGPLTLQTFGIMFALGFVCAGLLVARRFRELGKPVDWAYELIFAGLIGGVVGSRLNFLLQNWDDVSDDLLGNLFSGSGLVWLGGLIGGAAGVLVATLAVPLLSHLVPTTMPFGDQPRLDLRALLIAGAFTTLVGIGFGLIPAVMVGRTGFGALREGTRGGGGRRQWLRGVLVTIEVAVSVVLLISSGLLIRAVWKVRAVDPGFVAERVLTLRTALPWPRYDSTARRVQFYDRVLSEVRALPGVERAAYITGLPMAMRGGIWPVGIEGAEVVRSDRYSVSLRFVTPQFFATLGIPLLAGRLFEPGDEADNALNVVVSRELVRTFFPDGDALGKRVRTGNAWWTIVGVVGDVKQSGLTQPSRPELFFPYTASRADGMTLVIRSANDPADLTAAVRREVQAVDPNQPVYNVRTMEEVINLSISNRKLNMTLLTIFAGLATLLAVVGIYSVMSYLVTQHTREIGIRVALGARPSNILRLVLGQGLTLTLVGVGVGALAAFGLTRLMSSLLYGVEGTDPLTYVSVSLLLIAVALAACYVPARRAMKVDPLVALRYE